MRILFVLLFARQIGTVAHRDASLIIKFVAEYNCISENIGPISPLQTASTVITREQQRYIFPIDARTANQAISHFFHPPFR